MPAENVLLSAQRRQRWLGKLPLITATGREFRTKAH